VAFSKYDGRLWRLQFDQDTNSRTWTNTSIAKSIIGRSKNGLVCLNCVILMESRPVYVCTCIGCIFTWGHCDIVCSQVWIENGASSSLFKGDAASVGPHGFLCCMGNGRIWNWEDLGVIEFYDPRMKDWEIVRESDQGFGLETFLQFEKIKDDKPCLQYILG